MMKICQHSQLNWRRFAVKSNPAARYQDEKKNSNSTDNTVHYFASFSCTCISTSHRSTVSISTVVSRRRVHLSVSCWSEIGHGRIWAVIHAINCVWVIATLKQQIRLLSSHLILRLASSIWTIWVPIARINGRRNCPADKASTTTIIAPHFAALQIRRLVTVVFICIVLWHLYTTLWILLNDENQASDCSARCNSQHKFYLLLKLI